MARPSPVTDAVRAIFSGGRRHAWSLDELHGTIRERLGGADYSTVFRAVGTLVREGLIDRVDLGDGKAHFELHDEHHEHVRCDVCGRVAEVPGCVLEDASAAVHSSTGFVVTSHQVVFTGRCPDCA
jgi:Fur family transcriptional regulator, ferric uptake regulator